MFSKRLSPTIRFDRRTLAFLALLGVMAAAFVRIPSDVRSTNAGALAAAPAVAQAARGATPSIQVSASAADIHVLLADARAAREHHDSRSLAVFRRQLSALLGSTTIAEADAAYVVLAADIAAARERHDPRPLAAFHAQLVSMCRDGSIASAIEPCAPDGQG
jgi:hypothetical protein